MKRAFTLLAWIVFLILAGCSSNPPLSASPEPSVPRPAQTSVAAALPTQTLFPTATFTALPTLTVSPTTTPEGEPLREVGYDIAEVRFLFPREDVMNVTFRYRLDESRRSKTTFIFMDVPPGCMDDDNKNRLPLYEARSLHGLGFFSFKMTLQGVCDVEGIQFNIGYDTPPTINPPIYREFVAQPYRLVRNFPTVNSDTVQIDHFMFTPTSPWWGQFTFDFQLSEQIPLPLEEYYFTIYGFGPGGSCPFGVRGSLLTRHSGAHQLALRLPQDFLTLYQTCLDGADKYTYTASYLAIVDDIAQRTVYHHPLNQQFTIFRSP